MSGSNGRPWTDADLAELDRLFGEGVGNVALATHFGRTPGAMTMKLRQRYGPAKDWERTCACGVKFPYLPGPAGGRPFTKCESCRAKPAIMCRCCHAIEVEHPRRSCDACRGSARPATQRAWYERAKSDPAFVARRRANTREYKRRKRAERGPIARSRAVDDFLPKLEEWVADGLRISEVHVRLRALGYAGSPSTTRRAVIAARGSRA